MKLRLVFLWLFFAVCGTLKAYVPSDYVAVIDGIRTYIRMPHGADSVCAVLYCHRNMTEEVLFRSDNFCRQMDRLGVAMAFILFTAMLRARTFAVTVVRISSGDVHVISTAYRG